MKVSVNFNRHQSITSIHPISSSINQSNHPLCHSLTGCCAPLLQLCLSNQKKRLLSTMQDHLNQTSVRYDDDGKKLICYTTEQIFSTQILQSFLIISLQANFPRRITSRDDVCDVFAIVRSHLFNFLCMLLRTPIRKFFEMTWKI